MPKFAPAGQSTQMIVGATNETDLKIIKLPTIFTKITIWKRVYYSGYVPMIEDSSYLRFSQVPDAKGKSIVSKDWLMRFMVLMPMKF